MLKIIYAISIGKNCVTNCSMLILVDVYVIVVTYMQFLFCFNFQAEQKFLDMQVIRRQKQLDLIAVQAKLREIATELEKLQRGDDRYLALLTQEHSVIGDETKILREINEIEESEKTYFASLSSAVRESHEKERSRAERTKYWSVTASVIGAVLGIFGTSINNYLRMRELKTMVREQAAEGQSTKELIQNLSNSLLTQQQLVASFVDDVKNTVGDVGGTSTSAAVLTGTEKKLDALIDTNSSLQRDLLDIKQAISKNIVSTGHVNATVSEHDLTTSFRSVEQKLDSRLKSNAVYTASLVYGGFAISVAVLYAILKGT